MSGVEIWETYPGFIIELRAVAASNEPESAKLSPDDIVAALRQTLALQRDDGVEEADDRMDDWEQALDQVELAIERHDHGRAMLELCNLVSSWGSVYGTLTFRLANQQMRQQNREGGLAAAGLTPDDADKLELRCIEEFRRIRPTANSDTDACRQIAAIADIKWCSRSIARRLKEQGLIPSGVGTQ